MLKVSPIRLTAEDQQCVGFISRHVARYVDLMEVAKERDAISEVLSISRLGNQLMQVLKSDCV